MSSNKTDSVQPTIDFLTGEKYRIVRTLITTILVMLIAWIFWWISRPPVEVSVGQIIAIEGKCGYERNCKFIVTTENATVRSLAQPFKVGAQARLINSNADGLTFCGGDLCGKASIAKADDKILKSLNTN